MLKTKKNNESGKLAEVISKNLEQVIFEDDRNENAESDEVIFTVQKLKEKMEQHWKLELTGIYDELKKKKHWDNVVNWAVLFTNEEIEKETKRQSKIYHFSDNYIRKRIWKMYINDWILVQPPDSEEDSKNFINELLNRAVSTSK